MVLMEIVDLDCSTDTPSLVSEHSAQASPMMRNRKKRTRNINKLQNISTKLRIKKNSLLTKYKEFNNQENGNSSLDPDATLAPESFLDNDIVIDLNPCTTEIKTKNKRDSTIIIVDSDDDAVVNSKKLCIENNNTVSETWQPLKKRGSQDIVSEIRQPLQKERRRGNVNESRMTSQKRGSRSDVNERRMSSQKGGRSRGDVNERRKPSQKGRRSRGDGNETRMPSQKRRRRNRGDVNEGQMPSHKGRSSGDVNKRQMPSHEGGSCSEDDCEILCLSDTSVIEVSDTEDTGVVTGMVEFTKQFGDISHNNSRQVNNLELKENIGSNAQKNGQIDRVKIGEGNNDGPQHSYGDFKKTGQHSRQSISYLPPESVAVRSGLRPIVIDGSNVAFGHGKERFSAKGIEICVDYFLRRNHHKIFAFVPQYRKRHPCTIGFHILDKLEKDGYLIYTPSRKVDGVRITAYDDRFIVECAAKTGGIIITRDNYNDLLAENKSWSETIKFRVLQYTFAGDLIMFPPDPLGRGGPSLNQFLTF